MTAALAPPAHRAPDGLRWARRHGDVIVAWAPVNAAACARARTHERAVTTPTVTVCPAGDAGATLVLHDLGRGAIDNDLGALISGELVGPGLVIGGGAFERCFAGVVESTGPSVAQTWRRFYNNTLAGLSSAPGERDGPIATFARIYRHARELIAGDSVLDVGSCFAFFPILLAQAGRRRVTASDRDPAMVALARRMAVELGLIVGFAAADVTGPLPFAARGADTVTALHLLEHLPESDTPAVLERLCRVARRRMIAAVPIEEVPDPVYGHRQAFDLDRLAQLSRVVPGWRGSVHDHLGGWLVLGPDTRRGATAGRPVPRPGVSP
jgi:SAM-dependent methyltransferase